MGHKVNWNIIALGLSAPVWAGFAFYNLMGWDAVWPTLGVAAVFMNYSIPLALNCKCGKDLSDAIAAGKK